MTHLKDLVRKSQLRTRPAASGLTVHTYAATQTTAQAQPLQREEHWKRVGYIGQGGFGKVRLEECVQGHQKGGLRAVKVIDKSAPTSQSVDYRRELEAIVFFSREQFNRHFVSSLGWFESNLAVYIAMDYFRNGDLRRCLETSAPLSEPDAQLITTQLLEGLNFMHKNGFAHRDMKPGNILVQAKPPKHPWWVKLSDFGISKHTTDDIGVASTAKGTPNYMAPEMRNLGILQPQDRQHDPKAADIWATGEITFQMLTKSSAFRDDVPLLAYVQSPDKFPINILQKRKISEIGTQFIVALMDSQPKARLTAEQALSHRWVEISRHSSPRPYLSSLDAHTSPRNSPVDSVTQVDASIASFAKTSTIGAFIASTPSARWSDVTAPISRPFSKVLAESSNLRGVVNSRSAAVMSKESTTSRHTPKGATPDTKTRLSVNVKLVVDPSQRTQRTQRTTMVKFFIVKSRNETNIEVSNAHGIWCCNKRDNTRLSNAYDQTDGEVYLIFSVNESRQYCGVAQMTSRWNRDVVDLHWEDGSWEGGFTVQWLSWTPIRFEDVEHLKHKANGEGNSINRTHFVSEVCTSSGAEMMQRFGLSNLFQQNARQRMVSNVRGSSGLNNVSPPAVMSTNSNPTQRNNSTQLLPYQNYKEAPHHLQSQGIPFDHGVQELRSRFDRLMEVYPEHQNPRSDEVYSWVKPLWNDLFEAVGATTSILTQPHGNHSVSLDVLDAVTTIIHMIPEWDNPSYNLAKRKAYEDIARAWAVFIYEIVRHNKICEFHRERWDIKLKEHNDISFGLMRAAVEAIRDIPFKENPNTSSSSTQTLKRKRVVELEVDDTRWDSTKRAYRQLFKR